MSSNHKERKLLDYLHIAKSIQESLFAWALNLHNIFQGWQLNGCLERAFQNDNI